MYATKRENDNRKKFAGRCKFGFQRVGDKVVPHEGNMAVVKRILELKDKGYTLRTIKDDARVHHVDGGRLSISTIQLIIKNRKEYEEKW